MTEQYEWCLSNTLAEELTEWEILQQRLGHLSWEPAYYPVNGMIMPVLYACVPGYHVTARGLVKTFMRVMWLREGRRPRMFDTTRSRFWRCQIGLKGGILNKAHRVMLDENPRLMVGETTISDKHIVGYSRMIAQVAKHLAKRVCGGQSRKVKPSFEFLRATATAVVAQYPHDGEAEAVAWLQNTLDTAGVTPRTLYDAGMPKTVVEAVQVLKRHPVETFWDYVMRVRQHPLARKVKLAGFVYDMLSDQPGFDMHTLVRALGYLRLPA